MDHLAPGTVIHRKVMVANDSAQRRHVDVYAGAAAVEGATFTFGAGATPNELTSWISMDAAGGDIAAWTERQFTVTIAVPAIASIGERYAVIWASGTSGNSSAGVSQVHRVGVRVYLDIGPGGEPPSDVEIGTLTTARAANGQPSLTVAVRNTGMRALDLSGTLSLSAGPAGLAAGPFPFTEGTTLAVGAVGTMVVNLPSQVPNGPWTATVVLTSGRLERTTKVTLTFPDPAQPDLTATKATSLPLVVGGGVAVLLVGLVVAFVLRRNRPTRPAGG